MKILYRQPPNTATALDTLGIQNCYCKYLVTEEKLQSTGGREHYHTDYEVHLLEKGSAVYLLQGQACTLREGDFLVIPPGRRHCAENHNPGTGKLTLTFSARLLPGLSDFASGSMCPRMRDNLKRIQTEAGCHTAISKPLIEGMILETVVLLWRHCGMKEEKVTKKEIWEDTRVTMAKQYVADNIEQFPSVCEVAAYCALSAKQLSRLFERETTMSLSNFMRKERVAHAQMLLQSSGLSLAQISERLHFSSEYCFISFFKKYAGMTPARYRKMYAGRQSE